MANDSNGRHSVRGRFLFVGIALALLLGGRTAQAAGAPSAQSLYDQGLKHERGKDYVLAVHDFKAALKSDPAFSQAYGQLGNCYYYLGHKDWALTVYDRYLKDHPKDLGIRKTADGIRAALKAKGAPAALSRTAEASPEPGAIPVPLSGTALAQASDQQMDAIADLMLVSLKGPAPTPAPSLAAATEPLPVLPEAAPKPVEKSPWVFGLGGAGGTYSMSNWNSLLNGDSSAGGQDYEYSGSAVRGGVGLRGDLRYFFSPNFSGGFFLEYWGAGGSFTTWRTVGSSTYDATGLYSLPFLFLGPQASYVFYRPKPRWKLAATVGLGYAALLGAYLNYTTYTVTPAETSEIPTQSGLSDGGFGVQLSLDADYVLTPGYSLTAKLGYRSASMGKVSGLNGYFQNEQAGTGLDFSGIFLGLGIAYWP